MSRIEVTDQQRRILLGRRHGFEPGHRLADVESVTRAMTALHATEPATVHLAVRARAPQLTVADVDSALYDARSVVKQLAMRRTLFVFPRDLLPAAWGSASARVAEQERKRVAKNLLDDRVTDDPETWMAEAREQVLAVLRESSMSAQQVREAVPMIDLKVSIAAGTKWGGPTPIGPRVLTWLGARAEIVRGVNGGHWRTSRPAWTPMEEWLGELARPLDEAAGYAELVRGWLHAFGPGSEADLVWWLGATKGAVRRALTDVGAVEVGLSTGVGWMLPDDLDSLADDTADPTPWAALLPTLDPTTMGWRERDFHLPPAHVPMLFDRAGNGGNTAWVDGRVVGGWFQDDDGVVHTVLLEEVPADRRRLLEAEAARLAEWLDGLRIANVYQSQVMKQLPLG